MAFDLPTGKVNCHLPLDDFRPEASGSGDWTENEVGEHYRDWKLTRDEFGRPLFGPKRNGD